jgi:hypothetical protein
MQSPIHRISKLLQHLPKEDIELGKSFLENNDIENLKMLVDAAVYLVKKNRAKDPIPEKYQNIDLYSLMHLKGEVDCYYALKATILGDEIYESELDAEIFNEEL